MDTDVFGSDKVSAYVTKYRVCILLVDDDATLRDDLRRLLTVVGFDLDTARSGDEALGYIAAGNHYDVILTDIVMPGKIQGNDLAALVQREMPTTRVVLMTGDPRVLSRKIKGAIRDDMIVKPISAPDLVSHLQPHIEDGHWRTTCADWAYATP
jgi:CheY-like chemotaxis protein